MKKERINYCGDQLDKLKTKAENAEKEAIAEKEKAQKALAKAEEMQLKVETAMFDKAVKEQNKEWKGYANYDWTDDYDENTKNGLEILEKTDSLDLSNNALLRLPKEVAECPNIKHINLLGNRNINWQASAETLEKLNSEVGIYVSVYDLDSIPSKYWNKITGIEILQNELNEIPQNILQQKQLVYLDLSGERHTRNNFTALPLELFQLINLQYLNLSCNQLSSLPPEIGNLSNLTELNLCYNQLSSLPLEIGNLNNLTKLSLWYNEISSLPLEIGNLTNLTTLDLESNELTTLPPEIGNLSNLTELYLMWNKLSRLPSEIGNLSNLTTLDLMENDSLDITSVINAFKNFSKKIIISTNWKESNKENSKLLIIISEQNSLPLEIENFTNFEIDWNSWANNMSNAKNYKDAIICYKKAIELKPDNNDYYNSLGVMYSYLEQYEDAIICYKKAIELNPDSDVYYNNIGSAYFYLEQYEETIIYYKKASELNPDKATYNINIGVMYYNLKQYEDAIIYYKKASEIDTTNAVCYNYIGLAYFELEQYEEAIIYFKKASEIKSDHDGYYNLIGVMYSYLEQYEETIIYYKKASEINPDNALYYSNIGWAYSNLEQYEEAIIYFKKAIELEPDNDVYLRDIAVSYRNNKEYEKSLTYYNKAIELNPTGNYYQSRAFAYIKLGKFPEAKADLEKAESLYPDNKWIYIYWSCYYSLQKNTEKALENLQTAIDKGFANKKWLETETSLDFIRSDKRYIEIVEKME